MTEPSQSDRVKGQVVRVLRDYGFIRCDDLGEQEVYFKPSWFYGSPPLRAGDVVTFELKRYGENLQAHRLAREADRTGVAPASVRRRASAPTNEHLYDWAYLGYVPNTLAELASLALAERWQFKNTPEDPEHPLPILLSYVIHTFQRLVLERKVVSNRDGTVAAFNTGLVDKRYEPIYAIFGISQDP